MRTEISLLGLLLLTPNAASFAAPRSLRRASLAVSRAATPCRRPTMQAPRLDDAAEAALDALVRQEIESAFAGLEESLAAGDDDALEQLIRDQGKVVLDNVMRNLEDEGDLLSSQLAEQIEAKMRNEKIELLKKCDEQLGELQVTMNAERQNLRKEMENLKALNAELTSLQGPGISRDKIVSGIALLVGLSGVGAAVNEALKLALGANGDVATLSLNSALGVAGVLYHLQRKG